MNVMQYSSLPKGSLQQILLGTREKASFLVLECLMTLHYYQEKSTFLTTSGKKKTGYFKQAESKEEHV